MASGITIELKTLEMIQVLLQDNLEVNKERLKIEKRRLAIEEERLSFDTAHEARQKDTHERNNKMFDSLKDMLPSLMSYYQRTFAPEPSVEFRFEDLTPEQVDEMAKKLGIPPTELEKALSSLPPGVYPPGFGPESFVRPAILPVDDPTRICVNKKCGHFRQAHLQGDANCLMGGCECDKFEPGEDVVQQEAPDDFLQAAGLKK